MSHGKDGQCIGDSVIGNLTLDEAAENDMAMLKDAEKNAKRYIFDDPKKAIRFVAHCYLRTLGRIGVVGAENIDDKMLARIFKTKHIKIEHRDRYKGDDLWRNGIYIYRRDLLVTFISDIRQVRGSKFLIQPITPQWSIVTNAKVR